MDPHAMYPSREVFRVFVLFSGSTAAPGAPPPPITETDLFDYFSKWGRVADVFIPGSSKFPIETDRRERRRFAFVTYESKLAVYRCLGEPSHSIRGENLRVFEGKPRSREAKRDYADHEPPRLFVGALPEHISNTRLREYFAKFGDVVDVHIPRLQKRGVKGYAFITFRERFSMYKTLAETTHSLDGYDIRVMQAEPKPVPSGLAPVVRMPFSAAASPYLPVGIAPQVQSAGGQLFFPGVALGSGGAELPLTSAHSPAQAYRDARFGSPWQGVQAHEGYAATHSPPALHSTLTTLSAVSPSSHPTQLSSPATPLATLHHTHPHAGFAAAPSGGASPGAPMSPPTGTAAGVITTSPGPVQSFVMSDGRVTYVQSAPSPSPSLTNAVGPTPSTVAVGPHMISPSLAYSHLGYVQSSPGVYEAATEVASPHFGWHTSSPMISAVRLGHSPGHTAGGDWQFVSSPPQAFRKAGLQYGYDGRIYTGGVVHAYTRSPQVTVDASHAGRARASSIASQSSMPGGRMYEGGEADVAKLEPHSATATDDGDNVADPGAFARRVDEVSERLAAASLRDTSN